MRCRSLFAVAVVLVLFWARTCQAELEPAPEEAGKAVAPASDAVDTAGKKVPPKIKADTQRQERSKLDATTQGKSRANAAADIDSQNRGQVNRDVGRNQSNQWRYRRHGREWWYWMPGSYWMYYRGNRWHRFDRDTFTRYQSGYRGRSYWRGGRDYYNRGWNGSRRGSIGIFLGGPYGH